MNLIKPRQVIAAIIVFTSLIACNKEDYFNNTGRQDGTFNGTVFDYLKSRPDAFDSIVKIIHLAGMEQVFTNEDITFFAPADSSVRSTLSILNLNLGLLGQPLVYKLEQIKPEVWRQQLSRYIFKGKKTLNDYPQLDGENISAYPGQIYSSYNGDIMNIGVIYNDAGTIKYAGYRQLTISYIPSVSSPRDYKSWYTALVASVNIHPANGYVHALNYTTHFFGFEPRQFIESAIAHGID